MAKDRLLGSTLINSWNFLMSCFISCFTCWIILVIINAVTQNSSDNVPNGILLVIVFLLVLLLQCMELPVVGKKFACSIVPLLILAINSGIQPGDIWDFLVDAIIGAGCAVVGNVLPLPVEFSATALQQRLLYCAGSTTALLGDIFKAWQYQSCFSDAKSSTESRAVENEDAESTAGLPLLERSRLLALHRDGIPENPQASIKLDKLRSTAKAKHGAEISAKLAEYTKNISIRGRRGSVKRRKVESKLWRKLRLTVMTVIQFKLNRGQGLGWYFSNNTSGGKFVRMELIKFLRDGINEICARNVESKFSSISPLRRFLFEKYDKLASLLRDALSIASILEQKVSAMEDAPELNYIYRAFHNMPSFRHALCTYVACLCTCIDSIATCLVQCDQRGVHPIHEYNEHIHACIAHTAALVVKQSEFEKEYYLCRRMVYYEHIDPESKQYYTKESREDATSLPLNADVLMNMNSFLFLNDALCTLIVQFWSVEELKTVQEVLEVRQQGGPATYRAAWTLSGCRRALYVHAGLVRLAVQDLFPSQVAAFRGFLPFATPEQRRVALVRLRSAFSVAVAMTLASAYGLYLHRAQPFLAAFTIAFLAGGAAAGAAMVTSLNRAAGTVVACVWAIITQLILDNGGSGRRGGDTDRDPTVQQQLIIGFAVVLLQIPATVVRSYPMQGYAGTCASFTICIMLLAPNLRSSDSTDRIIDTFVGVVIYLAVELVLSAASTEGKVLSDMDHVFRGVDERFAGFYKNFLQDKRWSSGKYVSASASIQDSTLRELNIAPMNARIKAQGELLRYVELEPGLRRPPALPPSLLAECVELQEQAVSHLQVMYWAVRACADDPATYKRTQEFHQLYAAIAAAHKTGALAPVQLALKTSPRSRSGKWSKLAKTEDEGIETVFRASQKKAEGKSESKAESKSESKAESKVSQESKSLAPVAAPHPKQGAAGDLLLPLEGSFIEVGHYVSVVVCFLRTAVQDISAGTAPRVRKGTKGAKAIASLPSTLEGLGEVRRARVQSHTEFLGIHIAREELALVLHDADLLSKVEAQHEVALFSRFQSILEKLLKEVVDSVATTVVINGVRARTPRQNKKVKVVNAMIASTMDLVRALRGLASVVSKLRAHRDIRVTQTGTKLA
jgi:hypothetical protein